ncbi:uncharacterized protein LOC123881201 [Maniola jurtina]|uniref:uncharacterized protein LOC123881201 n=1 Tax=Maniola jurtina TaxID=191418 RepID=UPI001E68C7EF|nr:uncharacterized protein LOC123881201 [Maniola jurtina]
MFLYYSFNEFEMLKSNSLEKINRKQESDASNETFIHNNSGSKTIKRRSKRTCKSIFERYHITIKPKLYKSNSLSDLSPKSSDISLDFLRRTENYLYESNYKNTLYDKSGDTLERYWSRHLIEAPYMSWNLKGKKSKKKCQLPDTYASKFASEYVKNYQYVTSSADNSSMYSVDEFNTQKMASFPFKPTPSGNLKVQSNQVVFQSSTVGVLLADPTQAKVKVKFEGKATGELKNDENNEDNNDPELRLQYGPRETNVNTQVRKTFTTNKNTKIKPHNSKDDSGEYLSNLGYTLSEPVDWMRVQLPKKKDLFQEFYRRIHNFINTDTIVHIGREEFHCHHVVLEIYSSFFEINTQREIELPCTNVTPESFHTIYEWMIFSGPESNKILKRDNVLDLFCAAQYLGIKDLEDQCWSFIANENLFNEDSAFALYREARLKGITPVMDLMVPRVMRFFLPLVASKDFLDLEPEEVMTFLKSNFVCVTSEIEILMAGVRWLYGDWASRSRHAVEMMQCVRFGLISPWQLVDIKRNPENAEILEVVNEPEIQQMVDDGLAYVIIKYWYGNNSKNYYHWIDVLGLTEPAERNWIGEEKNHVTYKDFLKYLEEFQVPKEQMYQQMAMMQPTRRTDDNHGNLRGMDDKMETRRPKFDFPLPATLKGLTGDKFPTVSDVLEGRKKANEDGPSRSISPPPKNSSPESKRSPMMEQKQKDLEEPHNVRQPVKHECCKQIQQIHVCKLKPENMPYSSPIHGPPVKDSEDMNTTSETSSEAVATSTTDNYASRHGERRHSIAASYLAAATAALSSSKRESQITAPRAQTTTDARMGQNQASTSSPNEARSPQTSMFNQSKESLARINMNKLSTSILGPSNKNYITDGSLFNWDRETVLVFGGIDPHTSYGVAGNTGKDIFRFDPVTNSWDLVGELPEPRHHHSVSFLRGRVFLVGGADPREDDLRGKSVVVSTVWSFEPVTRSWYSESGLAVPRKNFGLVVHRMALYAIGGQDKKGRVLRSVERFDPRSGSWSEVRAMSTARMAAAVTKYRDYIWVAGGMTGEKRRPVCNIVECYNSKTNEWTEIHSLRFPRCFATLFSMNDKLYIIGGAGKMSDKDKTPSSVGAIDVWNWKERQWKLETEMSIPRHGHALAYLGTQLIIIGGVTTIYMRALSNVESFCCERGAWIRGVATLPTPLSGHGAVTLPPASLM